MPHKTAAFTIASDTEAPTTTSDAAPSYIGPVTIKLTADDGVGSKGAQTTYYRFDDGPVLTGTTAQLAQPASGTETHAISFWSVDYSGNVESEKRATFEVTADTVGPTASSNLLPAPKIYAPSDFDSNWHLPVYFYPSDPDPSSGIAGVRVTSTNSSLWFFDKDISVRTDQAVWDASKGAWRIMVRGLGTGSFPISYQARDKAGNLGPVQTTTILCDQQFDNPQVFINNNASSTVSTSVTLNTSATRDTPAGIADMRFSNDGIAWTDWEPYTTTKAWTLDAALGVKRVYAQYRDTVGNVSYSGTSAASDTILLTVDGTPPVGTISINSGAGSTADRGVALTLSATDDLSGVTRMRFSHDSATWTAWEAYATSRSWTLDAALGTKTVYVQFEDGVGNVSSACSDTITLYDGVPPIVVSSLQINYNWSTSTNNPAVRLAFTANDVGGSGLVDMRFSNDAATWSEWEPYYASYFGKTWMLEPGRGPRTVYVQYRDGAGNTTIDSRPIMLLDGIQPEGTSITLNNGDRYTNNPTVTAAIVATDTGGSGLAQMRFTNGVGTWGEWRPYAATSQITLDPALGQKTVWFQVMDGDGNTSYATRQAVITITDDFIAPVGTTMVIANGSPETYSASVRLTLGAADTGGSGLSGMRFSNDGVSWSAWQPYSTMAYWMLDEVPGIKTAYVQFRDNAGNISATLSDTISLYDVVAPTGSISINDGAASTSNTGVSLTLNATDLSGVASMRFSNDNSTWSAWESYASSRSWTLTAGDGTKTVYVQYRDTTGMTSSSFSDSITLEGYQAPATLSFVWPAAETRTCTSRTSRARSWRARASGDQARN